MENKHEKVKNLAELKFGLESQEAAPFLFSLQFTQKANVHEAFTASVSAKPVAFRNPRECHRWGENTQDF